MSDSSMVIKKYFHSLKTDKMNSVIQQVENMAEIVGEYFKADFCSIIYRNQTEQTIMPVAIYKKPDFFIDNFPAFEYYWCQNVCYQENLKVDYYKINHSNSKKKINEDDFADLNQFNYALQIPFSENGKLRSMFVVYWKKEPNDFSRNKIELCQLFYKLLKNMIIYADNNRVNNDYSMRLSELIAMFELSVGNSKFENLLGEVLSYAVKIVPSLRYSLFSYDNNTKEFLFNRTISMRPPIAQATGDIIKSIKAIDELHESSNQPKGQIYDISNEYSQNFTRMLIAPLCLEYKEKYYLACWSVEANALNQNDLELLSVFALFAANLLRSAILVKNMIKTNEMLKKSSGQLAQIEAQAALTDMTSGLAHEFNNTIGGIIGRIQIMKVKNCDSDVTENLDKIEKMAGNAAGIVRRLQEYTSGVKSKKLSEVDLNKICHDYFGKKDSSWGLEATQKEIKVDFQPLSESAPIEGNAIDLMVALDKLLENAVYYANEKSLVKINFDEDHKYFIIRIHNEGKKIPENNRKKVFYPFFTTRTEYGAGLGLAIVHGIVLKHSGKIDVTSTNKDGTTFSVYLPKIGKKDADSEISYQNKKNYELSILVVDDDEQIREVLTDMLTIDGYHITACPDGFKALKAFAQDKFDLVITDLGMPGMSGLELAETIHNKDPKIPIAMITGWGMQLHEDEVKLKGVQSVISKPFHLKDIKELIASLFTSD